MTTRSIKNTSDFKKVLNLNQKTVSQSLVMFCYTDDNNPNQDVRLGLIVSKKNGNSPVRNRIKRRLRSAFSLVRSKNKLKISDIVLIAKKQSYSVDFSKLVQDITYCLNQNKMII